MTQARDPETIQREIEQTRSQLAATLDALADRASPKRAASRGASAVWESPRGRMIVTGTAGLLVVLVVVRIVRRLRS